MPGGPFDFGDIAPTQPTPDAGLTPPPPPVVPEGAFDFGDIGVSKPPAPTLKKTPPTPQVTSTPQAQPQQGGRKIQPITAPEPVTLSIGKPFNSLEVPNLDDRALAYQNPGMYLSGIQNIGTKGSPVVRAGADLNHMSSRGISATARLAHALKYSQLAKEGYTFVITSGYRGNSTTHHGAGDAVDIQIFKDGQMVGSTSREGWGIPGLIKQEQLDAISGYAKKSGFKGLIDEINYPTEHATGPHIHFAVGAEGGTGSVDLAKYVPKPLRSVAQKMAVTARDVMERLGNGAEAVRSDYIKSTAKANGFSPADQEIFLQQLEQESGRVAFRRKGGKRIPTESPAGAIGISQFMPETLDWVTSNPQISGGITKEQYLNDPGAQVRLGARYMKYLLTKTQGNWAQALVAYNAGEGYLNRFLKDDTLSMHNETRGYVANILGKASGIKIDPNTVDDLVRNPNSYDPALNRKFQPTTPDLSPPSTANRYLETLLQFTQDTAIDFGSDTVRAMSGDMENLGKSLRDPNLPTMSKAFMGGLAKATNALTMGAAGFGERLIRGKVGDENYEPWLAPWRDVENAIDANWDDMGLGSMANSVYELATIGAMLAPVSLWGRFTTGGRAMGGAIGESMIGNRLLPFVQNAPFFQKVGSFLNEVPHIKNAITFGISAGLAGATEKFYDKIGKGEYKDKEWQEIMGDYLGTAAHDSVINGLFGVGMSAIGSVLGAGAMAGAHMAGQVPEATAHALSAMLMNAESRMGQASQAAARGAIGVAGGGFVGSGYDALTGDTGYGKLGAMVGGLAASGGGLLGGKVLAHHLEKYMAAMENPMALSTAEAWGAGEATPGFVAGLKERMHPAYQEVATKYFTQMLKNLPPLPTKFYEALTYDAVGAAMQANRRAAASMQYDKMLTHMGNIYQDYVSKGAATQKQVLQKLQLPIQVEQQKLADATTQLSHGPYAQLSSLTDQFSKANQQVEQATQMMQQATDPKKQKLIQGALTQYNKNRDIAWRALDAKRKEMSSFMDPSGKSATETFDYLKTAAATSQSKLAELQQKYSTQIADLTEKIPLMEEFEQAMFSRLEWLSSPEVRQQRTTIDPYVYKPGSPDFVREQQSLDSWLQQAPEVKVNGRFSDPVQQEAFEMIQDVSNKAYKDYFMSRGTSSAGVLYQDLENQLVGQYKSMLDPAQSLRNIAESTIETLSKQLEDLSSSGVSKTLFHRAKGVLDVPEGETVAVQYKEPRAIRKGVLEQKEVVWVSPSTAKQFLTDSGVKAQNQDSYFGALTQHTEMVRQFRMPSLQTATKGSKQAPFELSYKKGSGWDLKVNGGKKNPSKKDAEIARLQAMIDEGETAVPISVGLGMADRLEQRISKYAEAEGRRYATSLEENLANLSALKPFLQEVGFNPQRWKPFDGILSQIKDVTGEASDNVMAKQVNELLQNANKAGDGVFELTGSKGEKTFFKPRATTPESQAMAENLLNRIGSQPDSGAKVDALRNVLRDYRNTASDRMGKDLTELRDVFWSQFTPEERGVVMAKQVNDLQQMLTFANDPGTLTARLLDSSAVADTMARLDASLSPEQKAASKAFLEGLEKFKYYQPNAAMGHSMLYLNDTEGSYQQQMSAMTADINARGGLGNQDAFGVTTQELPNFLYYPMQALWKISRGIEQAFEGQLRATSDDFSRATGHAYNELKPAAQAQIRGQVKSAMQTAMMFPERIGELVTQHPYLKQALAPMYYMVGEMQKVESRLTPEMKQLADSRFRMSVFPRLNEEYRNKVGEEQASRLTELVMEDMRDPGSLLGRANSLLDSLTKEDHGFAARPFAGITQTQHMEQAIVKAMGRHGVTPDEYVMKPWQEAAEILPDTKAKLERIKAMQPGSTRDSLMESLEKEVTNNQSLCLCANAETNPARLMSARFRSMFGVIHANDMIKYFNSINMLPGGGDMSRHPNGLIHLAEKADGIAPLIKESSGKDIQYKMLKDVPGYRNWTHTTDTNKTYKADQIWVHPEWAGFVENYFQDKAPQGIQQALTRLNKTGSSTVLLGSFLPHYTSLFSNFLLEHGILNPLKAVGVMRAGTKMANSELGYFLQADAARSGLNIQTLDRMSNLMAAQIVSRGYSPEERSEYFAQGPMQIVNPELSGSKTPVNPFRKATNWSFGDMIRRCFSSDSGEAEAARRMLQNTSQYMNVGKVIGPTAEAAGAGMNLIFNTDAAMNMAMLHKPIQQAALASYYLRAADIFHRQASTGLKGLPQDQQWRISKQVAAQITNRTAAVLPYYWNASGTRNMMNTFMTTPDWFRNQANAFMEATQSVLPIGTKKFSSLPKPLQEYVIKDSGAKFRNALTGLVAGNSMISFMTSGDFDVFHPVDSFTNGVEFMDKLREDPKLLTRTVAGNDVYATPAFGMYRMFGRSLIETFGNIGKPDGMKLDAASKYLVAGQAGPFYQFAGSLTGLFTDKFSEQVPAKGARAQVKAIARKAMDTFLNTEELFGTSSRGTSMVDLFGIAQDPSAPRLSPEERILKAAGITKTHDVPPSKVDKGYKAAELFVKNQTETRIQERLEHINKLNVSEDEKSRLRYGLRDLAVNQGFSDIHIPDSMKGMGKEKFVITPEQWDNLLLQSTNPEKFYTQLAEDRRKSNASWGVDIDLATQQMIDRGINARKSPILSLLRGELYEQGSPAEEAAQKLMRMATKRD